MSFSQAFTSTAMLSALSTLTNFCFSHMVSLGQPDLIKDSQTVYMHQITPACIMQCSYGLAVQSPSLLLFSLFLPLFFPRHWWLQPLQFLCLLPSLYNLSLKSCYLFPSLTFFLHVFSPFNANLLPVTPRPSHFLPTFPFFLQLEVKGLTLDTATSWKASSKELDHPLSSICNSVFSLSLTLLLSLSERTEI